MSNNLPTGLEAFFQMQWQDQNGVLIPVKRAVTQLIGATITDDPVGDSQTPGGRTVVRLGSGPTAATWTQALLLDFTTQANQTFATDGNYTVAGLTVTKSGSAQDNTPMANVNGTGLQIDPKQGDGGSTPPSLYDTGSPAGFSSGRNAPILSIPLLQVIPTLHPFMAVRVSVQSSIVYGNYVAGLTNVWAQFGFENVLGTHNVSTPEGIQYNLQRGASVFGQGWQGEGYVSSVQFASAQADLLDYPNDVGLLAAPNGLYVVESVRGYTGLYSGGFPTVASLLPLMNYQGAGGTGAIYNRVDGAASWAVYLAGINEASTGVASTYQATIAIKRLLVETA